MANSIFMEHLDDIDREFQAIMYEAEADEIMINAMESAIDTKYEAMIKRADAKVFAESGTVDDLAFLYQEAEEEAQQAKQGLWKTIINGIKNFFQKIANFFNEKILKRNVDPNGQGKVNKQDWEDASNLQKVWGKVKAFLNGIKTGNKEQVLANAGPIAAIALTGAGATGAAVLITKKNSELKQMCQFLNGKVRDILTTVLDSNLYKTLEKVLGAVSDKAKAAFNWINKCGHAILDWGKKFAQAMSDKAEDTVDKVKSKFGKDEDPSQKLTEIYNNARNEAKKKYQELKNDKSGDAQRKFKRVNAQYSKIMSDLASAYKRAGKDKPEIVQKNIEGVHQKLIHLFESVDIDAGEFALMMLEAMETICGGYDEHFLEMAMDPNIVPVNIYMEFADDDEFISNTLGVSTDVLDIYNEDAIEADKEDILSALEVF